MSVLHKSGVSPGAVISHRERNGFVFFPDGKESTPVGKSDRRFGAWPHGWSFTWINARAETTLPSADAMAHFVFLGIQTYGGEIHAVCLTWTRANRSKVRVNTRLNGNERRWEAERERGRVHSDIEAVEPSGRGTAVRASSSFLLYVHTVYSPGFRCRKLKS